MCRFLNETSRRSRSWPSTLCRISACLVLVLLNGGPITAQDAAEPNEHDTAARELAHRAHNSYLATGE